MSVSSSSSVNNYGSTMANATVYSTASYSSTQVYSASSQPVSNDNGVLNNTPFQETRLTKEAKQFTIEPILSAKLNSSIASNKQAAKPNMIEVASNNESSNKNLENNVMNKIDKFPISVMIKASSNDQLKSAVKNDAKQQIDSEKQVIVVEEEDDKLCLEENDWPTTECSESAVSNCSYPYIGLTYRLCYSSCQWSKVDTSQCKIAQLSEIHNLVCF